MNQVSLERRLWRKRAFENAFGRRVLTDNQEMRVPTGPRFSEADVRTRHPKLIEEVTARIRQENLNPIALESVLNVLARDLLPSSYLCKVHKVGL